MSIHSVCLFVEDLGLLQQNLSKSFPSFTGLSSDFMSASFYRRFEANDLSLFSRPLISCKTNDLDETLCRRVTFWRSFGLRANHREGGGGIHSAHKYPHLLAPFNDPTFMRCQYECERDRAHGINVLFKSITVAHNRLNSLDGQPNVTTVRC